MTSKNICLAAASLLGAFCLILPVVTHADQVIYSQPVQSPLVDAGGFKQSGDGYVNDDTFTLTQGASITSLQWWGSYATGSGAGFPAGAATGFDVLLGACSGSDCLSTLAGTIVNGFPMGFTAAMANETFLGTSSTLLLNGAIPVSSSNYSYQVNFASPVQLSSGEYVISIIPILPASSDAGWSWDAGTGGDGLSQVFEANQNDFDLAFALQGTPNSMPEPSTLLLVLIGGLCVLGAALARARFVREVSHT